MHPARGRLATSLLGSAAIHGCVVLALAFAPRASAIQPPPRAPHEVTFEIAEARPSIAREVPRAEETADTAHEETSAPPRRAARAREDVPFDPGPSVVVVETPEAPSTPLDAPLRPPVETDAERRERERRIFDPAAVARSAFVVEGAPSMRSAPASASRAGDDLRPRSEREVEQELSGSLRAEAMTKSFTQRERLTARPRPDGTYVREHHAFTAVITADGQVRYEDRPPIQTDGVAPQGRFDLNDAITRAQGGDPYAAERQRFEDDNAELIERLERQAREREMAAALRRLRGRLARLWAEESPAAQRRRQLFELWRDVDEGGGDGGARGVIEAFIRESLPVGHADAYSPEEIRRMNASLEPSARFDPYR
ncbi:hypothetical protein [Sandaracinus amylolyticus]|uniref:hypothetical protein n=1 Tax=Sandaracinus amylolyticus TaxID=927083 RepID=UPI001F1F4737|nr:hypothetical protein [Sandaracinus amylolyticus]UJR85527.1 Hypothetical protein I5071_76070 [Sandaracinus amylolyticus]